MISYEEFCKVCKGILVDSKKCHGEEETKNHLIMRIVSILGFSGVDEIKYEPSALSGRLDIELRKNGKSMIAVEAKAVDVQLQPKHRNQLKSYIQEIAAPVGILTNGVDYHFYVRTLRKENGQPKVDMDYFYCFSVSRPTKSAYDLLAKLSLGNFDKSSISGFVRKGIVLVRLEEVLAGAESDGLRDRVLDVADDWIVDSRILTTPVEHRVFGCLVGMVPSLGIDPDLVTCKDNSTYFAVNFAGEPLCKVYQDDKDSDATDGSGRIEFFERDCETGERARDYRNLPAKMLKPLKFSSVYDVCRGEIRKTVIDHIDLIRRMRGL